MVLGVLELAARGAQSARWFDPTIVIRFLNYYGAYGFGYGVTVLPRGGSGNGGQHGGWPGADWGDAIATEGDVRGAVAVMVPTLAIVDWG